VRLGFEEGVNNGYFYEYPLDSSAINIEETDAVI